MKIKSAKIIGWLLIVFGILVVVFSNKIVFPGLERIVGIESIVGKENVSYQPDGSYYFTGARGMARWIGSVVVIGISILSTGIWLLIRSRKNRKS